MEAAELKQLIETTVETSMKKSLKDFWIEREQHYNDHAFIFGIRKNVATVKKGGLIALGGGVFVAVGWSIKAWVSSLMKGGN